MNKKKDKTIKQQIIRSSLLSVLIPMILLGSFAVMVCYMSAMNYVQMNLQSTAQAAAETVKWKIQAYENVAIETGGNTMFQDPNVPNSTKQAVLDSISAGYGFRAGTFIDANGQSLDGNNYSDRDYFKTIMNGAIGCVSDPIVSRATGDLSVIIAAPVWKDGVFGGTPAGMICFVPDEEFLNDITRSIMISKNGTAFMLSKSGTIIANNDSEVVKGQYNYIELANTNAAYQEIALIHEKMTAGETGSGMYRSESGNTAILGYAPVDLNGWSIAVSAPSSDFLINTYISIGITILLVLLAGGVSVIIARMVGKHIGDPVGICTERIRKLSEGDLTSLVPMITANHETRVLADATAKLVGDINLIMGDVSEMLSAMAGGNFAVESNCGEGVYKGDFATLIDSVEEIKDRLNYTLIKINDTADQVSGSSEQVAGGSQILAQGATEQASSVDQLANSIKTIENKVNETFENCENGRKLVEETVDYIRKADEDMNSLTVAMQDISGATGEISRIIKAIEDIAFQTNILSLNAAVEAARAGEAGKGFSVVADEVRNLASKSAAAAHDTTELIERTISAVEHGSGIATMTAEAVSGVEERSAGVKSIVDGIAAASAEQAGMVTLITSEIQKISGAVQSTSSTAEESAAASEELSGQAQMLKNLIGKFTLEKKVK